MPFCKVCFDSGKDEKMYNSHCVKIKNSNTNKVIVLCPTLLSTTCKNCGKKGHTSSYCNYNNTQSSTEILKKILNITSSKVKKIPEEKKTTVNHDKTQILKTALRIETDLPEVEINTPAPPKMKKPSYDWDEIITLN
jgi:hypothetical protein